MSRPSFDVLTAPWIPVIRRDGSRDELGILDCLERAPDLREIRDPSPIVEFGLYRLLVAFALDALVLAGRPPEDPLDLKELIEAGTFGPQIIRSYVEECGDVFDLFHSERPFLQTARSNADKTVPIEVLFLQVPSGSEAIHWHHIEEGRLSVPIAQAARAIAAISPFMKQGGRGYSPSINGTSPLYAMPIGHSLFETLVLNLPTRPYGKVVPSAAWVQKAVPEGRRAAISTADALTWQPRQIALAAPRDEGAFISGVVFKPGLLIGDSPWTDPNLAYCWGDRGAEKVSMRRGRPLWRDAGALALLPMRELGKGQDKVSLRRPDTVDCAFRIIDRGEWLCLRTYGLRAKQANIFEWASSELRMPLVLGKMSRLGMLVEHELQLADSSARILHSAALALAPEFEREERKPPGKRKKLDKRSVHSLADRCERAYWQHLERGFHPLMSAFAKLDANATDDPALVAAASADWRQEICALALEQFELAAKDMDADGDALERQVRARVKLKNTLGKVLS